MGKETRMSWFDTSLMATKGVAKGQQTGQHSFKMAAKTLISCRKAHFEA